MSATSIPIHPHRFAEALVDLPLSNLHLKAAELRNSISHLQSSNSELRTFAEAGDVDCAEAMSENLQVIGRMEERISLLRQEVERRGFRWDGDGPEIGVPNGGSQEAGEGTQDHDDIRRTNGQANLGDDQRRRDQTAHQGGNLSDQDLSRLLRERLDEDGDASMSDGGVHL